MYLNACFFNVSFWTGTKAFQGALFAASQNYGGGIVKVENGTYLTGSIQLKSNTFLYLDADAFIVCHLSFTGKKIDEYHQDR